MRRAFPQKSRTCRLSGSPHCGARARPLAAPVSCSILRAMGISDRLRVHLLRAQRCMVSIAAVMNGFDRTVCRGWRAQEIGIGAHKHGKPSTREACGDLRTDLLPGEDASPSRRRHARLIAGATSPWTANRRQSTHRQFHCLVFDVFRTQDGLSLALASQHKISFPSRLVVPSKI